MTKIRIALAQLNFCVGDLQGNLKKHLATVKEARNQAADLIVFPELSLIGYPPEDLLLRPEFLQKTKSALQELSSQIKDIYTLIGHPQQEQNKLYNACSLIYEGKILGCYAKQCLPNYSVFDEYRYFTPGNKAFIYSIKQIPIGFIICEDVWQIGPVAQAVQAGARLLIIINAFPFEVTKHEERISLLSKYAKQYHLPIIYVNHVGGQDEIIFDGDSMLINEEGKLSQFAGFYNERLFIIDIDLSQPQKIATDIFIPDQPTKIYQALVLSVRDYIEKNHFSSVIIGVSGGIDSALTLAIAVDALGKDHVRALLMPSRYSADLSLEDGAELCKNVNVQYDILSIEPVYQQFLETLKPLFQDKPVDVTEENIQARCRAIYLMAMSNKFGYLVLTTGNRSELAVGYCTLYGDMAGGFAVLKDIPKTLVYILSDYRNSIFTVIPQRIIDRQPSAELAPNQKDEDFLPPYSLLDHILYAYLNEGKSEAEIIAQGFDAAAVKKVIKLIIKNEYKRRQIPVGPRINYKSFGKDWRFPITNGSS